MSTQGETSYEAFNQDESRLLSALGALATGSAHAACPIGPYPRVDNWGIPVCKSFDAGQNTIRQWSLSQCPAGSHPWVDERESRICQFFNQEVHYYDTSKGCPTGTYSWVDDWGNKTCTAF